MHFEEFQWTAVCFGFLPELLAGRRLELPARATVGLRADDRVLLRETLNCAARR